MADDDQRPRDFTLPNLEINHAIAVERIKAGESWAHPVTGETFEKHDHLPSLELCRMLFVHRHSLPSRKPGS